MSSSDSQRETSLGLSLPAGVEPYYDKGGILIINADCREILPHLPPVDLVLTDPPYGINLDTRSRWPWLADHAPVVGDDAPFDAAPLLALGLPTILWGANHFASRLPDARGWLAWDKATRNGLDLKQAEIEFAWSNVTSRPKAFRHMWSGAFRDSERGTRHHPCQKPVALLKWCIEQAGDDAQTILDPFMGSGTTLVAARDLGRKCIGIEIEEKYCEIAVRRLSQQLLPFGGEM